MLMSRSATALQRVCGVTRVASSQRRPQYRAPSTPSVAAIASSSTTTTTTTRRCFATAEGVGIGATQYPERISTAESILAKALEEEHRVEQEIQGYHRILTDCDIVAQNLEEDFKRSLPPETVEIIEKCFVHVDYLNYNDEIINGKGPMLFEAYSEYHLPCKLMRPFLRECVFSKKGKLRLAFMNAEMFRNQLWLVRFAIQNHYPELQVQGFPTVFALLDGKVMGKLTGYHNAKEIEEFVQKSFGQL